MKVPKYFEHKKRMARVAKPIIDVFLVDKKQKERKEVLRGVIKSSEGMKGLEIRRGILEKLGFEVPCYHDHLTGKLKFSEECDSEQYVHELVHKLKKHFKNHAVYANAITHYINSFRELNKPEGPSQAFLEKVEVARKRTVNLRTPTFLENFCGAYELSNELQADAKKLGYDAGFIESKSKPGAGLFYLRLVSEGFSPEAAEMIVLKGYVSEIREFSRKYEGLWKKVMDGGEL